MMSAADNPKLTEKPVEKPVARPDALPVHPYVAVIIVVFVYFLSQYVGISLLQAIPSFRSLHQDSTVAQFWYVFVAEALTLAMLYFFMRRQKISFARLGLVKPRLRYFGYTLIAYPLYFILNAAGALIAQAFLTVNVQQPQQTGFETAKSGSELIMTFISLVILPPLVEEIVMRGYLFGGLKNGLSVVKAALLTSAIFALAHLQFGSGAPLLWAAAIDTFILSLVLCYLRQKTGNLWAGIGLHALKNFLAFFVLFIVPHYHFSIG